MLPHVSIPALVRL